MNSSEATLQMITMHVIAAHTSTLDHKVLDDAVKLAAFKTKNSTPHHTIDTYQISVKDRNMLVSYLFACA